MRYGNAATAADPNYAWGWYTVGIVLADQQKKDQASSALRKAFDLFKSQNNTTGMTATNDQYVKVNGASDTLLSTQGRNERTNQATSPSGGGGGN